MDSKSLSRFLPGLAMARNYQRGWLKSDLSAGLILAAILVPQGMAYAELAGLPTITGLYTTILCLAGYAVFGPSRVLVLGPDSALGPMIAATILPLVAADGDPAKAIAYASILALMVGAITVLSGIFRLGFIADLLSKPTQIGYMNGLALTIVVGQLPKLFGFSVDAEGLIDEIKGFVHGLGETVPAALIVGVASLAIILAFDRWLPRIPGVLIAVIGSIVAVSVAQLGQYGVDVVGELPRGFPPFTIPTVGLHDIWPLLAGAIGIALVSLTDTISTASAFASRRGDDVDGNKEMIGIGAANLAAGLFQGFPVSTSGSRTAVATQNGAKTQMTGLIGAGAVLILLLLFPGLLRNLPQPTLAAVVIAASLSLADVAGMRRLFKQRRSDFWVAMSAFLGVALLGVLPGIGIAVGISILDVFRRVWRPYRAELGRVAGIDSYHDTSTHPDGERLPGLVMYRFDGPLFFANNTLFRNEIRKIAETEPRPRWIVVAAEPMTDVDTTAADMLAELDVRLNRMGCSLVFAEMKDPVKAKIERFELDDTIDPAHFFPTIDDAVLAYQLETGARWPSEEQPSAEAGPSGGSGGVGPVGGAGPTGGGVEPTGGTEPSSGAAPTPPV